MTDAFDAAWAAVQFHFYESPETFETARFKLANAILAAAADGDQDMERLKTAGLRSMAACYRLGPRDFGVEAIMPQRVHNARYWRSYCEETRTIAKQMKDPECKRMLIGVAGTYAELARRAIAGDDSPRPSTVHEEMLTSRDLRIRSMSSRLAHGRSE
jgi:hypothetical protein